MAVEIPKLQVIIFRFGNESFACQPKGVIFTDQRMGQKMVVEIIGHTKCLLVGKRVGIVQPPAGQRFKVMDDWAGRKAAELL